MESRAKAVRIGLFLLVGLGAMLAVALFLGRSRGVFTRNVTLHADFVNVSGLIEGAPVRLAGIDVGQVRTIRLVETPSGTRVRVDLTVSGRWLDHVRVDSVAELATMGLLGDMLVNISLGSASAAPVEDGDALRAREAPALGELFGAAGRTLASAEALTKTLETRVDAVLTEDLARDVGRIARASAAITERIVEGPGLAHQLLADDALAARVEALLARTAGTMTKVEASAARVERLVAAVERGDGLLHGAIYGEGGTAALTALAEAAGDLSALLAELRDGDGALGALVHGEGGDELVENLTEASAVLRRLMADLDAGKGTIGGLVRDPSIYQDLKGTLGKLRRNTVLKSVIRSTIVRDSLARDEALARDRPKDERETDPSASSARAAAQ